MEKRVVIIVVNWNTPEVTIACLESLFNHIRYPEILVFDNGSTDDSVKKITNWAFRNNISFESLEDIKDIDAPINANLILVTLHENYGFGVANNLGMEYSLNAGADYVLLINNDTEVKSNFLDNLLKTAINYDSLGILGCKIYYYNDPDRVWYAGGKIDKFRGAFYHSHEECSGIRKTDFVTGCLMLIPCNVLKNIGFFDDRFFLNVEDVDLSTRIKKAGYDLLVDCSVSILHKVSASIGGNYSLKNQYYFHRNRLIYFKDNFGLLDRFIFYSCQFIVFIPMWILLQFINLRFEAIKGAILGYWDFIGKRSGKMKKKMVA